MNLDLSTLTVHAATCPGLTVALATSFVEACSVCLEHNKHVGGAILQVGGTHSGSFTLSWSSVTAQVKAAHNDLQEATERGATCVALHLARELLALQVAQRSRKGGGFDYWMCPANAAPNLFQDTTRLEVSGILAGEDSELSARVKQKQKQISQSSGTPRHVIVVEFGTPRAHIAA